MYFAHHRAVHAVRCVATARMRPACLSILLAAGIVGSRIFHGIRVESVLQQQARALPFWRVNDVAGENVDFLSIIQLDSQPIVDFAYDRACFAIDVFTQAAMQYDTTAIFLFLGRGFVVVCSCVCTARCSFRRSGWKHAT